MRTKIRTGPALHPLASVLLAASSHNAVRRFAGPMNTTLLVGDSFFSASAPRTLESTPQIVVIGAALPAAEATRSRLGLRGEPPYHTRRIFVASRLAGDN